MSNAALWRHVSLSLWEPGPHDWGWGRKVASKSISDSLSTVLANHCKVWDLSGSGYSNQLPFGPWEDVFGVIKCYSSCDRAHGWSREPQEGLKDESNYQASRRWGPEIHRWMWRWWGGNHQVREVWLLVFLPSHNDGETGAQNGS